MPPMVGSFFSSGRSVTVTSVVSINPATLAAFCKAHSVTCFSFKYGLH